MAQQFSEYLKDSKKELKKVHWPDWPTVRETSVVVMACTALFALFLWLTDIAISGVFSSLFYS